MNKFVNLALERHRVLIRQVEIRRINKSLTKDKSTPYIVFVLVGVGIALSFLGASWIWSASLIGLAGVLTVISLGILLHSRRLLIRNIAELSEAKTNYMDHVGLLLKNHGFAPEFTVASNVEDETHSILGTKDGEPKVVQVAFIGAEAKITLIDAHPEK